MRIWQQGFQERRETGASALRRYLKARVGSCHEFISSSIACRRRSLDSVKLVPMNVVSRGGRHGIHSRRLGRLGVECMIELVSA